MSPQSTPILYSFRRCPYAMRARMSLLVRGIEFELREVLLREKPASMLLFSPKGTVPVLVQSNGVVLDESIDIMFWALNQSDPKKWLFCASVPNSPVRRLIQQNDTVFKHH